MCPGSKYTFSGNFRVLVHLQQEEKKPEMDKNAILTAVYGIKICWMMTCPLEPMHDSVTVSNCHCLTIFWQMQRFGSQKTVINANIKAFYGILQTFTAMKWDSNPTQCFEALFYVCIRSKYTFSGNFWVVVHLQQRENPWKWSKIPFWRQFTA